LFFELFSKSDPTFTQRQMGKCRRGMGSVISLRLRSTRAWLPRDLEVLPPVFERMRAEGPDFLQRNTALANEVQRTFMDIDEIEGQLSKAETAIGKAQALTAKYRTRLTGLCGSAAPGQMTPGSAGGKSGGASAGNGNGTLEHRQSN
jgi:hypothetical protein